MSDIYNPSSSGGGGAPSGPAGGDLGGTYPNPTVVSVADVVTGILAVANGGTGTTTSTGTGNVVLSTAPTLSNPVVGTQGTSDNSTKAASTAYVTTAIANAVAGVNPAVAVVVATTQASDTSGLTYNNGVAGVGATFTGLNNTALTFDGVTLTSLNQRVLVKNDTQSPSGAFNGVYYLTQLQTGILPPILTRALDYNQPSEINSTGAIPVVSGTVNSNTSWLLTSTVNTIGTDPLTYVQFSIAPSSTQRSRSISSISGNTNAASSSNTDYVYKCTATLTLTLPTAVGNINMYTIKTTSGTTTIATTGGQTIDGSSTVTISVANTTIAVVSDNSNWMIV